MKERPEEANEAQEERSERSNGRTDRITPHRLYLFMIGCAHATEYDEDDGEEE
jgi:hypothetical protein